jgi:outer membrane protein TolC
MLIKQAKEEWNVTQYERDEYYLNLEALVKERYFLYVQQISLLKVKAKAELDAESQVQQIKYKYEKGEELLENYNKSLINLSDRTQAKIETEGQMLVAKSRLEELIGKKLEEVSP